MASIIKGSLISRSIYGLDDVDFDTWLHYAYALLTIAGADHEVSEAEMNWLLNDFTGMIGAPKEQFSEKILAFDYKHAKLDSLLHKIKFNIPINYRRVLLYDAIKMSRADNVYSNDERKAVMKAAEYLGVPYYLARTIEGLVSTEKSLEEVRKSIFEVKPEGIEQMSPSHLRETSSMIRYIYGIYKISEEVQLNYGFALMYIAGADGLVSEKEREWLLENFTKMANVPHDIAQKIRTFDYKNANLDAIMSKLQGDMPINFARTLLYNAIKMASADDFADEERKAVMNAATLLGIHPNISHTMEYLSDTEDRVEKMRKTLFELKLNP